MSVGADCTLDSPHHRSTYRTYVSTGILGTIDSFHRRFVHKHLFRVHFVLRQVFYINVTEVAQAGMQGDIGKVYSLNFQTFHQFTTEVQASCRGSHRAFFLREDRLETFGIFRFYRTIDNRVGERSFAQSIQSLLKFIMRSVIQETKRTTTRSGIINYFGHH